MTPVLLVRGARLLALIVIFLFVLENCIIVLTYITSDYLQLSKDSYLCATLSEETSSPFFFPVLSGRYMKIAEKLQVSLLYMAFIINFESIIHLLG